MPIPDFRPDGWLPVGHHSASIDDVESVFAGQDGSPRRIVFDMLRGWLDRLRTKGMSGTIILDGSFVSSKPNPSDFDSIFVYDQKTEDRIASDPEANELLNYSACKELGFDLFIFSQTLVNEKPEWTHLDVFDVDTRTGIQKGVLEVSI